MLKILKILIFGILFVVSSLALVEFVLKFGIIVVFVLLFEVVVVEVKKQGLEVELIEFIDWIVFNVSLVNGDIDVNYFQYIFISESYVDFIDLVVLELQRCGCYKTSYADGALRYKLFGQASRLFVDHLGAAWRDPGCL